MALQYLVQMQYNLYLNGKDKSLENIVVDVLMYMSVE